MYRRARFVSLNDAGPAQIRLCHDVTGASAMVSLDTARLFLALPADRFVRADALDALLSPALQSLEADALAACLDALVGAGLVERPDRRVSLGYDDVAALYDARPPPDPALFEIIRAHTGPEHWRAVLDVGTGTGQVLEPLAAAGPGALYGVDLSEAMLERAAARCARSGIQVSLQQARAEALPFADNALSLVVVSSALWWFDGPRFWREVYRVLCPEGRIAVLTTGPGQRFYDLLERFQVKPPPDLCWDVATIVHDLPAYVGLLHFATAAGTMQLADRQQLVDMALSLAPRGSEDALYEGLEAFDGSGLSWPLTLPTVSSVAVLRTFRLP